MKHPITKQELPLVLKSEIVKYKNFHDLSWEEAKFNLYHQRFGDYILKENLERLYLEEGKGIFYFLNEFDWTYKLCKFLLNYHKIPIRSASEARNSPVYQENYKNGCLESLGVENPFRSPKVLEKVRQTNIERYGIENPFQSEVIKEKIKETLKLKYGVERCQDLPRSATKGVSLPQNNLNKIINSLGYETEMEICDICKGFNTELGREYNPHVDIIIKGEKLIFELYGTIWHGDPERFSENDFLPVIKGKRIGDIWEKDRIREEHIKNFGYKVIIVWESVFKTAEKRKNVPSAIKSLIEKYFTNKNDNSIIQIK